MTRQPDKASALRKDTFGWFSCAVFAVAVAVFISMLKGVRIFSDYQALGLVGLGVIGFACGLVGTFKAALERRSAVLSIVGMVANSLPVVVDFLAYAGAFRT